MSECDAGSEIRDLKRASRIPNLARRAPLSCGGASSESRGEADADVGVLDGTRLEAFLAAGTLHSDGSLNGIRQTIDQCHVTLVGVFIGVVPFIARPASGLDAVLKVKGGKEREPLGQLNVDVCGQVVVGCVPPQLCEVLGNVVGAGMRQEAPHFAARGLPG